MRAAALLLLCPLAAALSGRFWHITDLHWDPDYDPAEGAGQECPSGGSRAGPAAGPWGSYLCDAPRRLLASAVRAMRSLLRSPDFVLWTGDDTPHVPDEKLGEEKVLHIIENLTSLIRETFPDTKVYAAMGNHDFHPKNQFPGRDHRIYKQTAELWRPWLDNASVPLFRAGGFYSEKLPGSGTRGRMVVLNTNLYYDQNNETAGEEDPAGQFRWLEEILTNASRADEMVYIVGHVPPGFFEKKRGKAWFRSGFNERYLRMVQKHHRVIAAQFFGHHHTDTFRMFYSDTGSPINVMFLAPGVTPWKTTLPGVNNGANNPGIRVIDYDPDTLQVLDMVTYYLNLTRANLMEEESPVWEEEYRLTEAFQVPDGSAHSMQTVLERISQDPHSLQKYYEFNSVSYDLALCEESCHVDHVCAIMELDFTRYKEAEEEDGEEQSRMAFLCHDISMLRLFETFLESTPQLTLLLCVILQSSKAEPFQGLGLCIAFLCVTWSLLDYHQSLRSFLQDKYKLSMSSSIVFFLWNLFLICPRILAVALFSLLWPYAAAVHFPLVWLAMFLWVSLQGTDFMESPGPEQLYRAVVAVILYFSWFNVSQGRTLHRSIIYHGFILVDSALLALSWLWYRSPSDEHSYLIPVVFAALPCYLLGLALRVTYYKWLHPSLRAQEEGGFDEVDADGTSGGMELRSPSEPDLVNRRMRWLVQTQFSISWPVGQRLLNGAAAAVESAA